MAKPVKKPHTWTVADAKARLSELLRLANDQPQYIGSNRSHVVINTEAWEEAQQKPAMGPWLIDSLSISEELELPPREDTDREVPFS